MRPPKKRREKYISLLFFDLGTDIFIIIVFSIRAQENRSEWRIDIVYICGAMSVTLRIELVLMLSGCELYANSSPCGRQQKCVVFSRIGTVSGLRIWNVN